MTWNFTVKYVKCCLLFSTGNLVINVVKAVVEAATEERNFIHRDQVQG